MARPKPPPYAQLIAAARLAPPKMTIIEAARRAGISDTRWSQLENGYRMNRGHAEPEWAPADTLAAMARAVGVTAGQLADAGRQDAAGELDALPARRPEPEPDNGGGGGARSDYERLASEVRAMRADVERLTAALERRNGSDETQARRRAAAG